MKELENKMYAEEWMGLFSGVVVFEDMEDFSEPLSLREFVNAQYNIH